MADPYNVQVIVDDSGSTEMERVVIDGKVKKQTNNAKYPIYKEDKITRYTCRVENGKLI